MDEVVGNHSVEDLQAKYAELEADYTEEQLDVLLSRVDKTEGKSEERIELEQFVAEAIKLHRQQTQR